ncbi:MAG TPA: hypothetical protein VI195_01585, partial [Steroidobacteraceae bacterium]
MFAAGGALLQVSAQGNPPGQDREGSGAFDERIRINAAQALAAGRNTFRFDTFGDEAFWGDSLQLQRAIEGSVLGGVGGGLSPKAALDLGLKVDASALPQAVINQLRQKAINLNDPAVTVALLKLNAVVGVQGFFNGNQLQSVGITC